jgi:hypothetical protein
MIKLPVDSYLAKHKIFSVSKELVDNYIDTTNYKTIELNELYAETFYSHFLNLAELTSNEVDYNNFITCMSIAYFLIGNTESIRWMLKAINIDSTITIENHKITVTIDKLTLHNSAGSFSISMIYNAIYDCINYLIYDGCDHISIIELSIDVIMTQNISMTYSRNYRRIVDLT